MASILVPVVQLYFKVLFSLTFPECYETADAK